MAQWEAPSTNNERAPEDVGAARVAHAQPYLDVDGRVRWWTGNDALPAGTTPLFVVIRASDGVRVLSTDNVGEHEPYYFPATSHILIR
jgi:hypothetical protein